MSGHASQREKEPEELTATLPARGLNGPTVFATFSLALHIVPDEAGCGRYGPHPGHDVRARLTEVTIDLEPIRRRVAYEVRLLLTALRGRSDFRVICTVKPEPAPTIPWWREFDE